MSRIGKLPIKIPQGVKIDFDKATVKVQGPKGNLEQKLMPEIELKVENNEISVSRKNDSKQARAMHGLYRSLLNNMVAGVSTGFIRILQINGVGYRAEVKGKILVLNLGYSNPVEYSIPEGISVTVDANTKLTLSSIDKQQLGQVCSEIRRIRPPEPYKGKGVKYQEEVIRRKIGKAGVK